MQSQISHGNAHYCVFFGFVCLAFSSLSLLFIPQWQMVLSHLRAAPLSMILHSSPFDIHTIELVQNVLLHNARTDTATYQ